MVSDDRSLACLRYGVVLSFALAVAPSMYGQTSPGQPVAPSQASSQPQDSPSPVAGQKRPANTGQSGKDSVKEQSAQPQTETNKSANQTHDRLSSEAIESFQSQMRELQEEADQFGARARVTQESLRSIKVQMADQGLDLRSDVREAESRMNYLLSKAYENILRGDAFGAEADLKMAAYAADFIERFLGR